MIESTKTKININQKDMQKIILKQGDKFTHTDGTVYIFSYYGANEGVLININDGDIFRRNILDLEQHINNSSFTKVKTCKIEIEL